MTVDSKECSACHSLLPLDRFGPSKQHKFGVLPHCRECHRDRYRAWSAKNKEKIAASRKRYYAENKSWLLPKTHERAKVCRAFLDELKDNPCSICGGRFHPAAMDFHHKNGDKEKGIGAMSTRSRENLLKEVAKCDLLCSNCHRTLHATK